VEEEIEGKYERDIRIRQETDGTQYSASDRDKRKHDDIRQHVA
jgi:hypothetical protein